MVRVEHVSKDFGNKRVLKDLSFEVAKGEILGFLGPNAAGKTTTMRIITGFMPATEGTAEVAGFDVFENPLNVKKNIGYLPETPPLYPEMTVKSYIELTGKIKGVPGRDLKKRVEEVMERTAVDNVQDRLCGRLSKGYRQRVGLAQAIIHNPPVLILDEPTSGLDPKQIIESRNLIKELAGDHTIILSTHILPEVSMTCERVIIIDNGRIVAQDTPKELTRKLKGVEKLTVEVSGPKEELLKSLNSLDGIVKTEILNQLSENHFDIIVESEVDKDVRKDISRTIIENNWDLHELKAVGMSLEEIFLKIITREEEVN
ncbi:ABC transporter ATP-binding protein [candidate division KSB1 bacterium]